MIDIDAISMNNLDKPEKVELLAYLLENHPLDWTLARHECEITKTAPGKYNVLMRFRGVSSTVVALDASLSEEVVNQLAALAKRNMNEFVPVAKELDRLWSNANANLASIRRRFEIAIRQCEEPIQVSLMKAEQEEALSRHLEEARKKLQHLTDIAYPLFVPNGPSWFGFCQTVMARFN
jgi:uncharacterized protein with von Willebrand factor type A (vWA) domain